jgi:hypothetical protein
MYIIDHRSENPEVLKAKGDHEAVQSQKAVVAVGFLGLAGRLRCGRRDPGLRRHWRRRGGLGGAGLCGRAADDCRGGGSEQS